MGYLIVFLGGGIGAALRHGFNLAFARLVGTAFPYATLFENVSDSIVMGMLVATFAEVEFRTTGNSSSPPEFSGAIRRSRRFRSMSRCCMSAARSVCCGLRTVISRIVDRRAVRWARAGPQLRLSALVHRSQAELVEQRHVSVSPGIWRRQKFRPVEDRIGASQETKCLRFFAHVFPACG